MKDQNEETADNIEKGKIIYQECATHLRYMLDWRHKILLRFFVSIAALLIIIKWMWETKNPNIHGLIFLPFLLAAISSIVFFVMDKRNIQVAQVCRKTGAQVEQNIFNISGLFVNFGSEIEDKRGVLSYTWMLTIIYLGMAVIFTIASICAFFKYEAWNIISVII